ncbi:MAG: archaemetzincin family Zn-dependent metalloprotease [Candidatus Micrarchaeia archaeon]
MSPRIALVWMNRPIPYLHHLTLALEKSFPGCRLEIHEAAFFTQSFDSSRKQYNAEMLLGELAEKRQRATWQKADKVLAIVREDLFVPNLNFVFGLAGNKYAVVSLARLDPRFYGREDGDILRERMIKEAIHELGHAFGLQHCGDRQCVMSFSNTIGEVDDKTSEFCQSCRARLALTA